MFLSYQLLGLEEIKIVSKKLMKAIQYIVFEEFVQCWMKKAGDIYESILIDKFLQNFINLGLQFQTQKNSKQFVSELLQLRQITTMYSNALRHKGKPQLLIRLLEHSKLFRSHSILLKVVNNSIFYPIINNKKVKNELVLKIKQQCERLAQYNLSNLSNLKSIDFKQNNLSNLTSYKFYKELEKIVDNFFKILLKAEIIDCDKSLENNQDKLTLGIFRGQGKDKKYYLEFRTPQKKYEPISQNILRQTLYSCQCQNINLSNIIFQKQPEQKNIKIKFTDLNKFQLQFIFSQNLIILKYITNIKINFDNSDLIFFQCNPILFRSKAVTLEVMEQMIMKNIQDCNFEQKKQKILVFKCASYLSQREQLLTKILLMIDFVMICGKTLQPLLLTGKYISKVEQTINKCQKICGIFGARIEKGYENLIDTI